MQSISAITSNMPQPVSALSFLLRAEEADSKRVRVSKVGWFRDAARLSGSTLPRIWMPTLVFTVWSVLVAVAEFKYDRSLGLTNNVTPLLSVVVGLLLVFRNSSAFARWDEGRHAWIAMTATIRSMARSTLVNVAAAHPPARLASDGKLKPMPELMLQDRHLTAQRTALRMQVAFAIAVRHHVRGEYGLHHDDLRSMLPPSFGLLNDNDQPKTPKSARSFDETQSEEIARVSERSPLLFDSSEQSRSGSTRRSQKASKQVMKQYLSKPSLPLPLVIAQELSSYYAHCKKEGLLEAVGPAGLNGLQQNVNQLVDHFTKLERLAQLSIPVMYGIHLKQCVTAFLVMLPFVLVETMKWRMIPFITLTAAIFLGVEGLASELENPLGIDSSDLPLDLWCAELRNEVEHMIANHFDDESARAWY